MKDSLRTFIALDLCGEHKAILKNVQTRLKSSDAAIKWVEDDNYHITLKFLGNTAQDQIKPIADIMDALAGNTACFPVELGELGAFPSIERPEIIWAGLTQGAGYLKDLSNALEERLCTIGFPKETRQFHPHITIGRMRSRRNINTLSAGLRTTSLTSTPQDARHITLFESILSSDGPRYSVLHRSPLKT